MLPASFRIPLSYAWLSLTALAYWAGVRTMIAGATLLVLALVAFQYDSKAWVPLTLGSVMIVLLARHRARLHADVVQAETRFMRLLRDAPVGVWMTDTQGAIRYGNAACGWPALPSTLKVHPDDLDGLERALTRRTPLRCEARVWRHDQWRWTTVIAMPRYKHGVFQGHVGALFDIEARKEAETQVKRLIQERADLIAIVSHELRTPLTSIVGNVALLEEGLPAPVPAEDQESLLHIRRAADQLGTLIDSLLALREVGTEATKPHLQDIDVTDVVCQVVHELEADAQAQAVVIDTDFRAAPHSIPVDPAQLRFILRTLVSNGIKFAPHQHLKVRVADRADTVEFMVEDFGVGIAQVDLHRIAEPFSQTRSAMVRRVGGLGISLAIARALTEGMNGELSWDSKEGHGTTFTVALKKPA